MSKGKKRNKKYDGLPAKSVIGQIKSDDYQKADSEITPELIKELVVDIMKTISKVSVEPHAILGVGAIMSRSDNDFLLLLSSPGIQVVGTKESLKPVYERYNKLKK